MEQEQILSTLNEKLGQTSLSERTISDYVTAFLPGEGEEFDFDRHVGVLKSLNGNFSKSVADTVKQQMEEFKKNYKPTPSGNENPGKGGADEATINRIAELERKLNEKESSEKQQQILSKVRNELKKQGADDSYVLGKTLQGIVFDVNKSIEDTVKETLAMYDKEYTACRGKGAAPRSGGKDGGKGKTASDRFFERKAKKEKWENRP